MNAAHPDRDASDDDEQIQRLDKWLWFARIVKTRTLAAKLVSEGRVRLNRQRVDKPAVIVRPGDVLTIAVHRNVRVLAVLAPGVRRGPPNEAATLYRDVGQQVRPKLDRDDDD